MKTTDALIILMERYGKIICKRMDDLCVEPKLSNKDGEELGILSRMIERYEDYKDELDIKAAKEAMKRDDFISLDEAARRLGLSRTDKRE